MSVSGLVPVADVQLKSILVATDFSPASEKAVRHAVALARYYGSKLYLMHVVSALGFNMVGPEAVAGAMDLAWDDARAMERKLMASGSLAGLRHHVVVRDGDDVWRELEKVIQQEQIDMVVIGTHSRGGLAKLVLGSVAEQIFRHASCPVLTVGPHSPAEAQAVPSGITRPLLFPTDFGERSLRALPYALSFANLRGTRIALLHVLSSVPQTKDNRWYTAHDVIEIRSDAHATALYRLRTLIPESCLRVEPICVAEFGEPAEWILETAKKLHAEGIVMGLKHTAHVDAISHLPWLTTYKVVCSAVCPVLTIR